MTVHGFASAEDLPLMYREKLASSGLTENDGAELGFSLMLPEQTAQEGFWGGKLEPALRIPYFHPLTGAPMAAMPAWPPVVRARTLRAHADKKFPKYIQLPHTGNCAYYPRSPHIDWKLKLTDYTHNILITEGELKAAKACKEGYACLALGGVYNFKGNVPFTDFLPSLDIVAWARKAVFLLFDSDLLINPMVAMAAWQIAQKLYERGALAHLVMIPPAGNAKVGLDDFLVVNGAAALDELISRARQITAVEALFKLNEEYAILKESDQEVVDLRSCRKLRSRQLVFITTRSVTELRPSSKGGMTTEVVNAALSWLEWPMRGMVRRLIYAPEHPPRAFVENDDDGFDFNTWRGWRVEPKEGSIDPFTRLIDHLFDGAPAAIRKWFLDWLAYPIRYPGTKLFSAALLHGLIQGSGKTLVGETMGRIYGPAYTLIKQEQVLSNFNEWSANRSFILGDDITGSDRRDVHDKLKVMITQSKLWVNPKNLSAYEIDDHINWLFTSNRADALYLDDKDRRYFIWEVPEKIGKLERRFYLDYMKWLDGPGAAALLHWFQHRDLVEFDPGAPAPDTLAKTKMREEGRSPVKNWVCDLRDATDDMLVWNNVPMKGDLFSIKQLRVLYASQTGVRDDDPRLTSQLSLALADTGFLQVHGRRPVSCGRGKTDFPVDRYYAIRNADKWLKAPLPAIQKHLKERDQI